MITLQHLSNGNWTDCGTFVNEQSAWISLNNDVDDYRTINARGKVLTDYS